MFQSYLTRAAILASAMGFAAPASAAPVTYTLDAGQSWVYVLVRYDRNSTIAGHDHVVKASTFQGTVTWDADNPGACNVHIDFPVSALEVDPGNARTRAGLEGETSDGDKSKIKKNFMGKYQLEADQYPKISFDSTGCTGASGSFQVAGNLTMHGVSKPVTAAMKVTADAGSFKARGGFDSTHTNWGFEPYSALLGALKNDNALKFVVDVVGRPR